MAKKELPKAQLGGLVKAYQGAKAGFKLASKIKTRAKNIKAIGVTKKAEAVVEAEKKAARIQKAAETRAANKAANAKPAADTKKVVPKSKTETTPTPPTPKGKEPFVKSKYRQKLENASGQAVGALTYGTANITKKVLKNRIAQSIIGGGTTAYVMNKIAEGRRPVKIKKIKKK